MAEFAENYRFDMPPISEGFADLTEPLRRNLGRAAGALFMSAHEGIYPDGAAFDVHNYAQESSGGPEHVCDASVCSRCARSGNDDKSGGRQIRRPGR